MAFVFISFGMGLGGMWRSCPATIEPQLLHTCMFLARLKCFIVIDVSTSDNEESVRGPSDQIIHKHSHLRFH